MSLGGRLCECVKGLGVSDRLAVNVFWEITELFLIEMS